MEVCSSILAVKYLFKYCYKGHDCAYIKLSHINFDDGDNQQNVSDHDEIKQYLNTRYVCAPEACHRIFEFRMHNMSHAIYRLAVHLEGEQNLYFIEGEEEARLTKNIDSTITAWFKLNQENVNARQYLYTETHHHFVYNASKKIWTPRQKFNKPVLCRMYFVDPKKRELYFLRLLLLHVPGATSFENLRTFQHITYATFFEAAVARNLVKIDDEWERCLDEACSN